MNFGMVTVAAAAVAIVASAAAAQDEQTRIWEGAYGGSSLGYTWGGKDRVGLTDSSGFQGSVGTLTMHGLTADIHAGYRTYPNQTGLVVGGQLGLMLGRPGDSMRVTANGGDLDVKQKMRYALTARAIVGTELPEDTLVYGSLGLIHGAFNLSGNNSGTGNSSSADFTRTGYTVGLGVEKSLPSGMSVYGEYEYANFGKAHMPLDGMTTSATPKWNSIRVGVNYRF